MSRFNTFLQLAVKLSGCIAEVAMSPMSPEADGGRKLLKHGACIRAHMRVDRGVVVT